METVKLLKRFANVMLHIAENNDAPDVIIDYVEADAAAYANVEEICEQLEMIFDIPPVEKTVINEKRTSEDWAQSIPFKILDPDGWDRTNFQYSFYEELISKKEFDKRLATSTIGPHVGKIITKDL